MSETIKIQCPECSQRFDVTDDLLGKTVECGSCDKQFKVTDDTLMREKKKFYPGEKKGTHLEVFGNSGGSAESAPVEDVAFQTAQYQAGVDSSQVGPTRPRRTMATIIGIFILVIGIAVFVAATRGLGAVAEMGIVERYILAGFTAVLGGALVLFGMARSKAKGAVITLFLGAILLVLPALVKSPAETDMVVAKPVSPVESTRTLDDRGLNEKEAYQLEIGYDPIDIRISRHGKERVVAVFIRGAMLPVREKIIDYLHESIGKDSNEISYNRGDAKLNGLAVFSLTDKTIDEVAAMCDKFGRVNKIDRDLRVIDVMVIARKMVTSDPKKTLDKTSRDYEFQNYQALASIDPRAKMDAVKRLADAEPKAMRADITARMVKMLPESNSELQLELIRALARWSKPGDGAEEAALKACVELHKLGKVSKEAMNFLVDRKVDGAGEIMLALWTKDPVTWSETLLKTGKGAQILLLPHLKGMDTVHSVSAAEVIGKVGDKEAIPFLKEAMGLQEANAAKKSLQAAIDEIEKRP